MLTTGAEENLLKLKQLRGVLAGEEQTRWADIKAEFLRQKAMGGAGADAGTRVASQLVDLVAATRDLASAQLSSAELSQSSTEKQNQHWMQLGQLQQAQAKQTQVEWGELLSQLQAAQRATDESLRGLGNALARPAPTSAMPESSEHAAQLLGAIVQSAMSPVTEHLEHSRRQQLGLHRVLMQVATRMQEQIDALRHQPGAKPTLRGDEIDNAFTVMARQEIDDRK